MYIAKYWIKGITSEANSNVKSCLEAKFNFRQEIAPKEKNIIKSIIKNGLRHYLSKKGFGKIESESSSQEYIHLNNRNEIIINTYFFNLGFNLNMEMKGEVPRKEMFDLDDLNNFILTGDALKNSARHGRELF
ncbi:MAG: hypothetical protein KJ646_02310 [Nanoarchaeota archaeon]|nr:hypothetical protein [Nanoarchaeota archaeon]MBU4116411.1 hypothetical protein [Nanoarchaeota archaeon]